MKALKSVGLPFLIILVAIIATSVMIILKPAPEKKEIEDKTFLVEVVPVSLEDVVYRVSSQGEVKPKVQSALTTQVSGIIESVSDVFVNGGMFEAGDVLVTLEQADRQTDVKLAEAEVARATASYETEVARGKVAAEEWRSVNIGKAPELGLRKPQIAGELASLKAAKANLERAKRNLERTVIRAPYNGMVQSKQVDIGQFVSPGMVLASIVSTDYAEVRLPLTDGDLAYLDQSSAVDGSVILRGRVGGKQTQWLAKLTRDEGVMNAQARVIYAVAEVADPYKRADSQAEHILRFGSFVSAEITGAQANNMVVLPRNLVRLDGTVITVDADNKIAIKDVEVQRADDEYVYISAGLAPGDKVAVSAVPNAYDGMPVRLLAEDSPTPSTNAAVTGV